MGVHAQLKHHLWLTWAEIAIENEDRAWVARADPRRTPELRAGIVAVTGASFSFDGLYGELVDGEFVIPQVLKDTWTQKKTPRPARILETLNRGFAVGRFIDRWRPELKWLFGIRNYAVHHQPEFTDGMLAPGRPSIAADEYTTYSADAATRAVDLLLDVLTQCMEHPGRLVELVENVHRAIPPLLEDRKARAAARQPGSG